MAYRKPKADLVVAAVMEGDTSAVVFPDPRICQV